MLFDQHPAGRLAEQFHLPSTLEAADDLMTQGRDSIWVTGGATYVMFMASQGDVMPRQLLSLRALTGLDQLTTGHVGSMVTLKRLAAGSRVGAERALTMAASLTAGPSVRSLATVGGNVGSLEGDLLPALLVLDAVVHFSDGSHQGIAEYLDNRPFRIITGLSYAARGEVGWSTSSVKVSVRGMDWPLAVAAVAVRREGSSIVDARCALTGYSAQPTLCPASSAILVGTDAEDEALDYAADVSTIVSQRGWTHWYPSK